MSAPGRKRTLVLPDFGVPERPLSGKADIPCWIKDNYAARGATRETVAECARTVPPLPIIKKGRSLKEGLAYFYDWLSAADLNLRGSRFVSRPAWPADITEPRSGEGQSCPRYHICRQAKRRIALAVAVHSDFAE
jgi:hypothetical protein